MSIINSARSGCKDVFHSYLVSTAHYAGELELPIIAPEYIIPKRLIPFSKALSCSDNDQWVHFYEDDAAFERVWNRPRTYLHILKRYQGVITPDFSIYRDMPLVMQQWNTYRGRALGHWWQDNGIRVIPNVRTGDQRTYSFCCDGLPISSTIAVGSHGCIKIRQERDFFLQGLLYVINRLRPGTIIIYGTAPFDVRSCCESHGTKIAQFDSTFSVSRKAVKA